MKKYGLDPAMTVRPRSRPSNLQHDRHRDVPLAVPAPLADRPDAFLPLQSGRCGNVPGCLFSLRRLWTLALMLVTASSSRAALASSGRVGTLRPQRAPSCLVRGSTAVRLLALPPRRRVGAIKIAAVSMFFGVIFGLVLALMRLSPLWPLRAIAWFYIWFVRGTPQLLQLVFIFNALPQVGLKFDIFTAAVIVSR